VIKHFSPDHINLLVSFGLFVLIWIIQILHYPSFFYYEEEDFSEAMISHQRGISFVTIPLMLTELFVTCWIFFEKTSVYSSVSVFLVILIWLSTFFIQVPLHEKLLEGKNKILIGRLVQTNWIRTFLWTLKLLILIIWPYL